MISKKTFVVTMGVAWLGVGLASAQPASLPAATDSPTLSSIQTKLQNARDLQKQAEDELQALLESNPEDTAARFQMGELYRQKERWEEASQAYESVLADHPDDILARFRVGQCYVKEWMTAEATESIEQALRQATQQSKKDFPFAEAYLDLGSAYNESENYDRSTENYRKALELDPNNRQARFELAKGYYALRHRPDAKAELLILLAQDPRYPWAHYYLGVIDREEQNNAAAIQEFERELDLNPANYQAHHWIAYMLEEEHKPEEAKEHYLKLIALSPRDETGHLNLGRIYLAEKNYTEAIRHLSAIKSSRYNGFLYLQAHKLLLQAYRATGDRAKAQAILFQEPYLSSKLWLLLLAILLPAAAIFLKGAVLLRRIDPNEGEARTKQFHSFRQWSGRFQILGWAILGADLWFLRDFLDNINIPWGAVAAAAFVAVLLSARIVYYFFDRKIRRTQAKLGEYLGIYFKSLFLVGIIYGALFGIYYAFNKVPATPAGRTGMALLLLAVLYGYHGLAPQLIRLLNKVIPWPRKEIIDRLWDLARRLNVGCRDILLVKTDQFRTANALATGLGPHTHYVFIFNYALDVLDEKELESIFVHELAHLKFEHVRLRVHMAAIFLLANLAVMSWAHIVDFPWGWPYFVNILAFIVLNRIVSKRQEQQADEFVAANYDDPQALIRALEKIYASNYVPAKFKSSQHPTLVRRIEYLKKKIGQLNPQNIRDAAA